MGTLAGRSHAGIGDTIRPASIVREQDENRRAAFRPSGRSVKQSSAPQSTMSRERRQNSVDVSHSPR
jgi:hypothetical protein